MKHTYALDRFNNVVVDGFYTIETSRFLDDFERERQAYDIIDYILEDEDNNLKLYLEV